MYPTTYHSAMGLLVRLDIMAPPARMRQARVVIARALRDLRKAFPTDRAHRERDHMRYVNGAPWVRDWFKG